MKISAAVNSNYEYELFRSDIGEPTYLDGLRHVGTLDWIYFILNDNPNVPLFSRWQYPHQYLDYMGDLGFSVPSIVTSGPTFNWFGHLTDLPKERRLNSKLWSYDLLNRLGLKPVENHVVHCPAEARAIMAGSSVRKWWLKSPFLMAGEGFCSLQTPDDLPEFTGPHILEPHLDRFLDFALFHSPHTGETSFHINRVLPRPNYVGSTIFAHEDGFALHLAELGLMDTFRELKEKTDVIMGALRAEGLEQTLSVDGFFFRRDDGSVGVHPMCEVNYRHTMGGLMRPLRRFLPPSGAGEMIILRRPRQTLSTDFMPYSSSTRRGVIRLTPSECPLMVLFFAADSFRDAATLHRVCLKELALHAFGRE